MLFQLLVNQSRNKRALNVSGQVNLGSDPPLNIPEGATYAT